MAPDLDYLFVWAPQFNALHRVVTHNLFFVALVAGLAAALWPRGHEGGSDSRATIFLAALVGGLAHLLVDACMDTNPSNGLGVAWLWPVDAGFASPFNLMSLEPNPAGWGDPIAAARGVLRGLVYELPLWLLAGWWGVKTRSARTTARAARAGSSESRSGDGSSASASRRRPG